MDYNEILVQLSGKLNYQEAYTGLLDSSFNRPIYSLEF